MFKRGFKEHGPVKLSTFLLNYRVGDIVDIKANAAQQKGMPHKFYHGRTGIVYNVTPHAVGVIVNKCRQEFLERVKRNQGLRNEAKAKGEPVPSLRRVQPTPRESHVVSSKDNAPQTIVPVPYETTI
ncbi:60S ribosomal L21 [Pyrrhoderma noxium]|uniref:60S ribosomal L21 n=1 Tax=Pyrrhoderma noxium TaxID=2282107 RepID=A0A286USN9_9AGAM|nr:60S ribosomal L21 [Pyrrhoderma noxium]